MLVFVFLFVLVFVLMFLLELPLMWLLESELEFELVFLLDREIRGLLVQFRALDPRVHDMDTIDVSVYRERLNPIADERARATIVADRLAEQFNIEVTKEEIDSALLELSVQEKVSVAEVAQYMEQNDMLPGLTRNLQRDKVLEMLREKTAVTLVAPGSETAAIAGV